MADFEAALAVKFAAQVLHQKRVQFHCDYPSGSLQELFCKRAAARTDLDNGFRRVDARGRGNTFEYGAANKEMLSEFLARDQPLALRRR